jgi:GAF domain-containing protein
MAWARMTSNPSIDILQGFADVARYLSEQPDLDTTRRQVVNVAVKVIGCDGATLVEQHNDRIKVVAASDPSWLANETALAERVADGISHDTIGSGTAVIANDLTADDRWPVATRLTLRDTAARSAAGFPLGLANESGGALTLYSARAEFFSVSVTELARLFAAQTTLALALARHRHQNAHLQQALESSRSIGSAVGIVMHQHDISAGAAFDALRVASQHSHRKLADLAEQIVQERAADALDDAVTPPNGRS